MWNVLSDNNRSKSGNSRVRRMDISKAIVPDKGDVPKEFIDIEFKSSHIRKRLLANNNMQRKNLECKLTALRKEHRRSISKIDNMISEDADLLKRTHISGGFPEKAMVVMGETLVVGNGKDCYSNSLLFPLLTWSTVPVLKRRVSRTNTVCTPSTRRLSDSYLGSKAIERELVRPSLGWERTVASQSGERQSCIEQKHRPLQNSRCDFAGHEEHTKKVFELPLIVVTAPYSSRFTSLRVTKGRKVSSCFETAKSKKFEMVPSTSENAATHMRSSAPKTFADTLHVPGHHHEERILSKKGNCFLNPYARNKREAVGHEEAILMAEKGLHVLDEAPPLYSLTAFKNAYSSESSLEVKQSQMAYRSSDRRHTILEPFFEDDYLKKLAVCHERGELIDFERATIHRE